MSPIGKTPTVVFGTPPRPAPSLFSALASAPLAPLVQRPLSIESRLCLDLADALRRDAPDIPQIWAALCGAMSSRGVGLGHALFSTAPATPPATPPAPVPVPVPATTAPRKNLKPKPFGHQDKPTAAPATASAAATTHDPESKRERAILERFDPTPAWCNACGKEHEFDEFLRAGQGIRFMCIHDKTSDIAERQQAFFRRLMKDPWFNQDRHSWETVGSIIRSAIDRGLDPECDLEISDDNTDAAKFV